VAPVIVIYGPPGSGKTVQAQRLAGDLGYKWLSSGEMLRESGEPAILARIGRGELALSEDVNRLMQLAIEKLPQDKGLVLDGFPRMMAEIDWMMDYLPSVGRQVTAAVTLDVPVTETHRRLHQRAQDLGRHDDTDESIDRRWRRYNERMVSIWAYFKDKNLLVIVDGTGTVDEVAERVKAAV
jgi:adenylate kinase